MKKNKLKNQLIKSLQRQRKLRDEFERLNRVCGLLVNVDKKIADGVNIHTSKQPKESIQDVADELDKPFKEDKSGSYNITQVQDAVNHWSMAFIGIEQIREFLEKENAGNTIENENLFEGSWYTETENLPDCIKVWFNEMREKHNLEPYKSPTNSFARYIKYEHYALEIPYLNTSSITDGTRVTHQQIIDHFGLNCNEGSTKQKPMEVVDPGITTTIKDWYFDMRNLRVKTPFFKRWCESHGLDPAITSEYDFIGERNGCAFYSNEMPVFREIKKITVDQFKELVNMRMKAIK